MHILKKNQRGTIEVAIALRDGYDLLTVYGAYEVFIACPRRFVVTTVNIGIGGNKDGNDANNTVSTEGCPTCIAEHTCTATTGEKKEDDEWTPTDIVFIPCGTRDSEGSDIFWNKAMLKKIIPNASIVVLAGPDKDHVMKTKEMLIDGSDNTDTSTTTPHIVVSPSGADIAVHLVEQLAGIKARHMVEDIVEYKGHDPFRDWPTTIPTCNSIKDTTTSTTNSTTTTKTIGILIFDGFELLDTFGPMAVFVQANQVSITSGNPPLFRFVFYAETEYVQSSRGPIFRSDRLISNNDNNDARDDDHIDYLLIPSGIGTLSENYNTLAKEWTRRTVQTTSAVLTVCTGSGFLSQCGGILDGRKATTNKLSYDLVTGWRPTVNWQRQARWVHDDKYWTSSGVAAGTDQAIAFLEHYYGPSIANVTANNLALQEHRVMDATMDEFLPRQSTWIENMVINLLTDILFRFTPTFLRPKASTIGNYIT